MRIVARAECRKEQREWAVFFSFPPAAGAINFDWGFPGLNPRTRVNYSTKVRGYRATLELQVGPKMKSLLKCEKCEIFHSDVPS